MFGYATTIRTLSLSQGRGSYSMEPSHYEEVPRNVADEIIQKSGGAVASESHQRRSAAAIPDS